MSRVVKVMGRTRNRVVRITDRTHSRLAKIMGRMRSRVVRILQITTQIPTDPGSTAPGTAAARLVLGAATTPDWQPLARLAWRWVQRSPAFRRNQRPSRSKVTPTTTQVAFTTRPRAMGMPPCRLRRERSSLRFLILRHRSMARTEKLRLFQRCVLRAGWPRL